MEKDPASKNDPGRNKARGDNNQVLAEGQIFRCKRREGTILWENGNVRGCSKGLFR